MTHRGRCASGRSTDRRMLPTTATTTRCSPKPGGRGTREAPSRRRSPTRQPATGGSGRRSTRASRTAVASSATTATSRSCRAPRTSWRTGRTCASMPASRPGRAVTVRTPTSPMRADGSATGLERVKGIEPSLSAWEADVLPLNYTRARRSVDKTAAPRIAVSVRRWDCFRHPSVLRGHRQRCRRDFGDRRCRDRPAELEHPHRVPARRHEHAEGATGLAALRHRLLATGSLLGLLTATGLRHEHELSAGSYVDPADPKGQLEDRAARTRDGPAHGVVLLLRRRGQRDRRRRTARLQLRWRARRERPDQDDRENDQRYQRQPRQSSGTLPPLGGVAVLGLRTAYSLLSRGSLPSVG